MLEDAELVTETEIDGTTAELVGRQLGRDFDFSKLQIALDVHVGQDHSDSS
jgi:hypothetical protein